MPCFHLNEGSSNIRTIINIYLLNTLAAGLVRFVYDYLFNQLVHNFRCELFDMLIFMHHFKKCCHIGGLLFGIADQGDQLGSGTVSVCR